LIYRPVCQLCFPNQFIEQTNKKLINQKIKKQGKKEKKRTQYNNINILHPQFGKNEKLILID